MKKWRRTRWFRSLAALLLCAAMVLSLAGCSRGETESPSAREDEEAQTENHAPTERPEEKPEPTAPVADGPERRLSGIKKTGSDGTLLRETVFFYNEDGQLAQIDEKLYDDSPWAYQIQFTYNSSGQLLSRKGENFSGFDEYTYSDTGILTSSSEWDGPVGAEKTYDDAGRLIGTVIYSDSKEETVEYIYDRKDRIIASESTIDFEGQGIFKEQSSYTYDSSGRLLRVITTGDEGDSRTTYTYDYKPFLITKTEYFDGEKVSYCSQFLCLKNEQGLVLYSSYTGFYQPEYVADAQGYLTKVVDTEYDGEITETHFYYEEQEAAPSRDESYTESDRKAMDANGTVVATVSGRELTNGQLQAYYWGSVQTFVRQYGDYLSYFALDLSLPLDAQTTGFSQEGESETWQDYFLREALQCWNRDVALEREGQAAGYEISQGNGETLDQISRALEAAAMEANCASVEELVRQVAGAGCTVRDYTEYLSQSERAFAYYEEMTADYEPSAADVEAFFAANEAAYAMDGITRNSGQAVDVRHILIIPEGSVMPETGEMTYTAEAWAACETRAKELLKEWKSGEATEESFAALARTHSQDYDSANEGGLFQYLTEDSSMVEEFKAWYMDESREIGDTGLVKTDYGFHVMYLADKQPRWFAEARADYISDYWEKYRNTLLEKYPITVYYDAIVLGSVDLE